MIKVQLDLGAFGGANPADIVPSLMRSMIGNYRHEFEQNQKDTEPQVATVTLVIAVSHLIQLRDFDNKNFSLTPKWKLYGSQTEKFQTLNDLISEYDNLPEQVFLGFSNLLDNNHLSDVVNEDVLRRCLTLLKEAYWCFRQDNGENSALVQGIENCFNDVQTAALREERLAAEINLHLAPASLTETDAILKEMKTLKGILWDLIVRVS